jgi:DNA-binding transcriptional LysR family regulator
MVRFQTMEMNELRWDDIRVFLALARSTSMRDAARRLGLTHPTVRRHLAALEEATGLILFVRRPDGLHLSAAGEQLLASAEGVERSVFELARRAQAVDETLQGPIHVTAPTLVATMLAADMTAFSRAHPGIELRISVGSDFADLGRREADVAIRVLRHGRLPEGHLTGRKAASGHQAVYGFMESERWIVSHTERPREMWVSAAPFPEFPIALRAPNDAVRLQACREGMGLALLPCVYAESELPRLTEPQPDHDVWVLVHPDLRHSPRLRLFRDAMVAAMKRVEPSLQGRPSTDQALWSAPESASDR